MSLTKRFFIGLFISSCWIHSDAQINANSLLPRTEYAMAAGGPINLATGDLDGDGKKDVVVANQTTGVISIFRNTTSTSAISFAARIDSTVVGTLGFVHIGDMDGDGKADIVVSTGTNNKVAVYRNISVSGSILVSAKQMFTVGNNAFGMWLGDMDADGKTDVVTADYTGNTYSVLRNTSSSGSVSFAAAVTTSIPFTNPSQVILNDLDGDGKMDLTFFNNGGSVAVYRNTSSGSGNITFSSTALTLSANATPFRGDVADVDGDGKADIAASNYSSLNTSVFRNTSTVGTISFAAKVDFAAPGNIQSSLLKDLDLDGKPELIQSTGSGSSSRISISRNFSIPGSISSTSFGTRIDYLAADAPTGLNVTDLDNDAKPELLSANFGGASFSVF